MAYTRSSRLDFVITLKNKKILKSEFESTPYFYLVSEINHSNIPKIIF